MRHPWVICAVVASILVAGCAVQPAYAPIPLNSPAVWSSSSPDTTEDSTAGRRPVVEAWWTALGDPAIDALTPIALSESPTLAQAIARMDEARAALGSNSAQRLPSISADVGAERARSLDSISTGTTTADGTHAGLRLGWELDLFGRIRQSIEAASSRLDARSADAQSARLVLAAQLANGVVGLRACMFSEQVQAADMASRARVLQLVRLRLSVGAAAPVEEARAVASLTAARTRAVSQQEQCARQTHALTMLSGQDSAAIRKLVMTPAAASAQSSGRSTFMPQTPAMSLSLPASVLQAHPDVIAAEREVSAAWAEVGVARANRLPRIDLIGVLTGNWLRAGGSSLSYSTGSLAASLTAPLFDGGAGAANVDAASARYRSAEAALRQAVRLAAQDVENALTGSASAYQRQSTAQESLEAAHVTLRATQAQWEAGAVSLFELEDVRRQHATAEDDVISALRDSAQAWIALVQSFGNTVVVSSATPTN
ncbi:efflux transporter outer membrane subunit [Rhodoferax sp. U11-2br]|nr:efflux transporter outer membrane subunit [Rhodoferax sp. U11-2br]MBT3068836.1 efflux transporter outer membrane subunit [Rhodoferax sp. U11-2br]